ncbi:ABC-three component system middle component 6 [Paenibacillus jiagnxiensis]|uniref:ABC-three component system middle component 6 n=1 Tax=Paenibacillus jiagnxiensis TaxID=3228926 RepID=UPI0033B9E9D7
MLLPDNIHPQLSIYYNGALVLKELKQLAKQQVFDLYQRIKSLYNMSFPTFMLCLDWLYLIDSAKIDDDGWVELCS